jgi:chromosome partitioning protein
MVNNRAPQRISTRADVHIWTVANQKGGVGKTTTTVTLAGILAQRRQRVLLVDLDPHGSLTAYFGYDPDTTEHGCYALFDDEPLTRSELIDLMLPAGEGTSARLLAASPVLATVERRSSADGMGRRVSRALLELWDDFDFVLIDTPPVLGALMINALAASDRLLVPTQTEYLALKGLERMVRTMTMVTRSLQKELPYLIVPTLFDRRTHASVTCLRTLRNDYPGQVWPSVIPIDTRFRDASRAGVFPSLFDGASRGVKAYETLLKYLLTPRDSVVAEAQGAGQVT